MAKSNTAEWLPRVLAESFLIVISILVALALDEWRDQRQDDDMVRQALLNFASEISQNQDRIEDAAPFNQGLLDVLEDQFRQQDNSTADEFVMMLESYSPVVLQTTAWDTALATGSLAKMEYNLVSALSMTYTIQSRYQSATRSGIGEVLSAQSLSVDQVSGAVFGAIRYLRDVTSMEAELNDVYSAASTVIDAAIGVAPADPGVAPNSSE